MASALLSTLTGFTSGGDDADTEQLRASHKYVLRVTAGSGYDPSTHLPVAVNSDTATTVDNAHLTAAIVVRIRNYDGLPAGSPKSSPYFDDPAHAHDQYSLAFSFIPKADLPADKAVWGVDFDHSIKSRLPPGTSAAIKIVKDFVDPGLECDPYSDKPWLYGPALSSWFAFHIGPRQGEAGATDASATRPPVHLSEGAHGSGQEVRQKAGLPEDASMRRKHFLAAENRECFVFEKNRLYQGDFFNAYLDFNSAFYLFFVSPLPLAGHQSLQC